MKFIEKILLSIHLGVLIASIAAAFSPYVSPETSWVVSFFGLIFPILFIANIVLLFIWLLARKPYAWLGVGLLVWGILLIGNNPLARNFSPHNHTYEEPVMTLMTYNLNNLSPVRTGKNKEDQQEAVDEFVHFVNDINPDVLFTQETGWWPARSIIAGGYSQSSYNKGVYVGIFTKYKILNSGSANFDQSTNSYAWADILVDSTHTYRVFSLHLESNRITGDATELANSEKLTSRSFLAKARKIFAKYRYFVNIRAKQARYIRQLRNKSPYPVIIAGDFNDPPLSYSYEELSKGLQDTYKAKGKGLGTTFGGVIPWLRIDYILVPESFQIKSHQIPRAPYSDHYPVITKVINK